MVRNYSDIPVIPMRKLRGTRSWADAELIRYGGC